jgi:hypothetical protein
VHDGAIIGLGSGWTATDVLRLLGERARAGLKVGTPRSHKTGGNRWFDRLMILFLGTKRAPEGANGAKYPNLKALREVTHSLSGQYPDIARTPLM